MSEDPRPLILCLALDPATQTRLNEARERHFPPERNYLAAHLTMFHHLPAARAAEVEALLRDLTQAQAPIELEATGYRFLGRGVALE
ncbi:MAG: 2'-5' RNA ligase family protein, partial [Proteobacteria bacterium]